MSEYKKLTKEECADKLLGIEHPLILCHIRPDGDTVGSAKALSLIFEQLGRKPKIACADPIPERLGFIINENDLTKEYEGFEPIAIDVASATQLGKLYETVGEVVVTIDHHAVSTPFSPHYTVGEATSASEALMDIIDVLAERGLLTLTKELAAALYTAISSDSGCFCYSNVTPTTHKRAAELISLGIDFADINHRLFHTKSYAQISAESLVGSKIKTTLGGKVAYVCLSASEMTSNPLGKEAFECAIDVVRTLKGAEIAFTVKEAGDELYKISLRSTKEDISGVAASFGGGGHHKAAGCSVAAASAEDAASKIIEQITKLKI